MASLCFIIRAVFSGLLPVVHKQIRIVQRRHSQKADSRINKADIQQIWFSKEQGQGGYHQHSLYPDYIDRHNSVSKSGTQYTSQQAKAYGNR